MIECRPERGWSRGFDRATGFGSNTGFGLVKRKKTPETFDGWSRCLVRLISQFDVSCLVRGTGGLKKVPQRVHTEEKSSPKKEKSLVV